MRKFLPTLLLVLCCMVSCRTESKYHLVGVDITIGVKDVTRGYVRAEFSTSRDAYYVTGCMPVESDYDPENKSEQFMVLMVDSLYREYLDWRYDYLKDQEDYIADFASHSLQYGLSERFFQGLEPDTAYWVYAFVVDPDTKSPYGDLYLQLVETLDKAENRIWFDTRVQGSYLYMYPRIESDGAIAEDVPYTGGVLDSLAIVSRYPYPEGEDFSYSLNHFCEELYSTAYTYGILPRITYTGIRQINFSGEWTPGNSYYIYMGELDGDIVNRTFFRFTYDKESRVQDVKEYFREKTVSEL